MRRFWLTARQVKWLSKKSSLTGGWDTTTLILHAARLASQQSPDEGFTLEDVIKRVDQLMEAQGIEFTGAAGRGKSYRTPGERVTRGRFGDLRRSGFFTNIPPAAPTYDIESVEPLITDEMDGADEETPQDLSLLHRLIVYLAQNDRRSPFLSAANWLGVAPYRLSAYLEEMAPCPVQRHGDELLLDPGVSALPTVPPPNGTTRPWQGGEVLSVKTVLGQQIQVEIPRGLVPQEIDALKAVVRHGRLTEHELRRSLKTRRATGLMEVLVHKLQQMHFDALRIEDAGPLGNLYVFDRHRLPLRSTT